MEVVVHVVVVVVFIYLGLPLFLCLLRGSYVAHLGVLWVFLLLGGCPAS